MVVIRLEYYLMVYSSSINVHYPFITVFFHYIGLYNQVKIVQVYGFSLVGL